MNREAAVLGRPACSIYAGKLAAVDRAVQFVDRLLEVAHR
jgi:predicted glycosyltransferase